MLQPNVLLLDFATALLGRANASLDLLEVRVNEVSFQIYQQLLLFNVYA